MKKIICVLLSLMMVLSMSLTVFADGEESWVNGGSIPAEGTELVASGEGQNNTKDLDVEVGLEYVPKSTTINSGKQFKVTLEYQFPDSVEVYVDQEFEYTWDSEAGKYVIGNSSQKLTEGDEKYALSDEGAFKIKLTNKSNVDLTYKVEYAANSEAAFASSLNGDMTNDSGLIPTIAQGQEIIDNPGEGKSPINIIDATTAIADRTEDFKTRICSGNLKVTGLNSGKTLEDIVDKDNLGTFTVTIEETKVQTVGGYIFLVYNTNNGLTYTFYDATGSKINVTGPSGDAAYYEVTGTRKSDGIDKIYVVALDPTKETPTPYEVQGRFADSTTSSIPADFGREKINFKVFLDNDQGTDTVFKQVGALVLAGYDDWYIGSQEEVKYLFRASEITTTWGSSHELWVSSLVNNLNVWSGVSSYKPADRSEIHYAVPIRSF